MDSKHQVGLEGNNKVMNKSSQWRVGRIFLTTINSVNHVLILFVTGYILYLGWDLSKNTNLHAVLCTIGVSLYLRCILNNFI